MIRRKTLIIFRILFVFFILPLVACPLSGQVVQKKHLTADKYKLWGETYIDKISPEGKWCSFKVTYENGADTLFVKNTFSKKAFYFPFAGNSTFTENSFFICLAKDNLYLLNLKTGKIEIINDVSQYNYSISGKMLVVQLRSKSGNEKVLLRTIDGKYRQLIDNSSLYSLSPEGQNLLYSSHSNGSYRLTLLSIGNKITEKHIIADNPSDYIGLTWQKLGKSFAFIARLKGTEDGSVFYYQLENKKLYEMKLNTFSNFPKNSYLSTDYALKLMISDDQQKVFFNFKIKRSLAEKKTDLKVEIWNAADRWVHWKQELSGSDADIPKTGIWFPAEGSSAPVTTNEFPKLILSADQKFAFLSNPKQYEPQYELHGPRDYYILNLQTFERKLLLEKHAANFDNVIPSPKGNLIAYFKKNNWWIYNISANSHINITKNIDAKFSAQTPSYAAEAVFGFPGWSTSEKEALIYDQYGILAVNTDGNGFRRIAPVNDSNIKYRMADIKGRFSLKSLYDGTVSNSYDLFSDLYLSGEADNGKTGYFKWNARNGITDIIFEDSYTDGFCKASNMELFFCRKQNFDKAPQILVLNNRTKSRSVFQSNPQQTQYHWGHSELIRYKNKEGKDLKGVLFFPADYNPEKKYPMIVNVYQIQSKKLHQYKNPTLSNGNGFNQTVFTLEGYFVLLPDIINENHNPGLAAADCVNAAVLKVMERKIIDPKKIGIMGHSFGGYESSFVITQSDMFAAASAGGSITNLTSFYLNENKNNGQPEMWRLENGQWAMRNTPFENPLLYNRNSPIEHVKNVQTPLLLWTGKSDEQVDPHQSMEFHLALRRLSKKNIMLQYPKEGHDLSNPQNRQDLTKRILQWFNHYLKDETPEKWITEIN